MARKKGSDYAEIYKNNAANGALFSAFIFGILMLVLFNADSIFEMPEPTSVEPMNAQVLQVVSETYETNGKAGPSRAIRYKTTLRFDDGVEKKWTFLPALIRGQPPRQNELIGFKKATYEDGSIRYVLDMERWDNRVYQGSQMAQ